MLSLEEASAWVFQHMHFFLPLQSTTLSFAIAKKNQDFKHFQAFIIQRFIFFFKISTETRRNPLLFSAVRFQMSPHTQRKSIKKKTNELCKKKSVVHHCNSSQNISSSCLDLVITKWKALECRHREDERLVEMLEIHGLSLPVRLTDDKHIFRAESFPCVQLEVQAEIDYIWSYIFY